MLHFLHFFKQLHYTMFNSCILFAISLVTFIALLDLPIDFLKGAYREQNPTNPFTSYQEIGEFYIVQKRRDTDFKTPYL